MQAWQISEFKILVTKIKSKNKINYNILTFKMLTILIINMNIFITHIYGITMILKNHMFNIHLSKKNLNACKNCKT